MCKTDSQGNLLCDPGNSNQDSNNLDGVGWGGSFMEEGIYVCLQLIHIDVWQKPTQYCKAIILQLKINKFNYEKKKKVNR